MLQVDTQHASVSREGSRTKLVASAVNSVQARASNNIHWFKCESLQTTLVRACERLLKDLIGKQE